MYTKLLIAGLVSMTLVACSSTTEQQTKAPVAETNQAAQTAKVDDKDTIVCQRVKVTGSNLKERRCRTKGQLAEEREVARKAMDNINSTSARGVGADWR
ncbi:MAG: hypothetical protein K2W88_02345 [Pararheinheimera sp.]|nr:hypothetical protein [Rheinheimera sp.]